MQKRFLRADLGLDSFPIGSDGCNLLAADGQRIDLGASVLESLT